MRTFINKSKVVIALFSILLSNNIFAAQMVSHALPEFSADYAVEKYGAKMAQAHYQLDYTQSGYKFSHNTELYGLARLLGNDSVSAISLIDDSNGKLLLKKHKYVQIGSDKNKDELFNILWDTNKNKLKGTVTGVSRDKKVKLNTHTEVWEALSFQIPLMIDANIDVKEYPYKAILKGEINTYNFILTSSRSVSFAGNQYQALQMVRKDPNKDRELHIWLIPQLHNIPVIIESYRNGIQHTSMQLESVQFNKEEKLINLVEYDADENDEF